MSVFIDNNLEKEFITDATKEKYIASIKNEDLNNIDLINKKLRLFSKISLEKIFAKSINKIIQLIQFEIQQTIRAEQRIALSNFLKNIFAKKSIDALLEEIQDKSIIRIIAESIINWYDQDADPINRFYFVQVMIHLKEIQGNSYVQGFEERIRNFISGTINIDILDKIMNKELYYYFMYFVNNYRNEFHSVIVRIYDIFAKISNYISSEF